jgi:hypothetical protein
MARVRGQRRSNSPLIYLFLLVTVYALWSAGAAAVTADTCGDELDAAKEWNFFPPGWECKAP